MARVTLPNTIDAGTEIIAAEHQENYEALRDVINGDLEGGASGNLKANGVTALEIQDALLLRGMPPGGGYGNMQEGVVAAGDCKVTTSGSGLGLNYAAGNLWITDDSGLLATGSLLPATIGASTATVGAAHASNPRIDQVIATLTAYNTATVSVLAGTATGGATLDNRTGATALPDNALRLADILVPATFTGPFVNTTHIRDRRPWARGAFYSATGAATGSYSTTSSSAVDLDAARFSPRIECSGVPLRIRVVGTLDASTVLTAYFGSSIDGVVAHREGQVLSSGYAELFTYEAILTLAAGSHVCSATWSTGNGTLSMWNVNTIVPQFSIQEDLRQNSDNSGA